MLKRLLIHIKDKLNEPTYRELWEEQNKMLDKNKEEKRKLLRQIVKLKKENERLSENE
jgi:hypothetical protein